MKILTILAGFIGVLSLFANIALGYGTYTLNLLNNSLRDRLDTQKNELENTLSSLEFTKKSLSVSANNLKQKTSDLADAKTKIESLETQIRFYGSVMCTGYNAPKNISSMETNADLFPSIQRYVQEEKNGENLKGNLEPKIYTNSNDVVYNITYRDISQDKFYKTSFVIVWSWTEPSRVTSIFDISNDCFIFRQ